MGTRDTVKTAVFISAFLCLAVWNAVLQTNYGSNLKEVERKVKVHDGNLEQVEGQLERYFEHLEGKLETHDSNFEQVTGKLENHHRKLMEHRNLIKTIDETAPRRMKRSLYTYPQITGGATYIRWGRTVCPNDAELVYTGFAAGRHSEGKGGGSDYICLSDDPKYANYGSGHVAAAHIYGVELKITGMSKVLLETTNARFSPLDNSDVQCAVCRSRSNPSMVISRHLNSSATTSLVPSVSDMVIGGHCTETRSEPAKTAAAGCWVVVCMHAPAVKVMIPGTTECSDGWKMEYWGYLMTGQWDQIAQHSFACLDHAPEAGTDGGTRADGGALMYHVRGECGSLPCRPYVAGGYELTCVVCTK